MRPTRAALPAALLTTTLALAACSSGGTDEPVPDDRGSTDASPGPTAEPAPDDAAGGTDPACLVGAWDGMTTDPARLLEQMGVAGLEPQVERSGAARVEFDGERMTSVFEDQRTTLTLRDDEGTTFVSRSVLDGSTTGTYTVEDGAVVVTDVDASGLSVEQVMEVDGTEIPMPAEVAEGYEEAFSADGGFRFTCTDDELHLTPQVDGEDVVEGYVQVLERIR